MVERFVYKSFLTDACDFYLIKLWKYTLLPSRDANQLLLTEGIWKRCLNLFNGGKSEPEINLNLLHRIKIFKKTLFSQTKTLLIIEFIDLRKFRFTSLDKLVFDPNYKITTDVYTNYNYYNSIDFVSSNKVIIRRKSKSWFF